jgi:glyoxylase-like metal-dependent hydrolase (beta-lactamase superfamily II)
MARVSGPHPVVKGFFDADTGTVTYVVSEKEQAGQPCVIIDSVLNFDAKAGRTSTESADAVANYVQRTGLNVHYILETHAHADHLSAAPYLKKRLGGQIGIGANITQVQKVFNGIFNLEPEFRLDGSQFDLLLNHGDTLTAGNLHLLAMSVPGHTPACMAYQVGDAVFVGDTLFMPDVGTARCDFPGGNARALYHSVRTLLTLPPETRLFMCHDYPPPGRAVQWECTVADQRARNIHVHDGVSEDEFVAMRTARDATLDMPRLILPSVQVNIRAGKLPPAESNGTSYLKIPLNVL